ncbi:MAG: DNA-3-methyladenine glycosylase 2 family protein [Bacteroidota bacterium]
MIKKAKEHLSKDLKMKRLVENVALDYYWKVGEQGDVYFHLLKSIIAQQVSVKAAAAMQARFLTLFEDQYPHTEQLLEFNAEQLRAVSLSRQKAQYVQNVAQFFTEHQLFDKDWRVESDESILENLTQIKGIGEWTVQMTLMFCLNRGDVLPVKDLAIQQTMAKLYDLEEKGKALMKRMEAIGEAWRPYRTLACYYLWSWKHQW